MSFWDFVAAIAVLAMLVIFWVLPVWGTLKEPSSREKRIGLALAVIVLGGGLYLFLRSIL